MILTAISFALLLIIGLPIGFAIGISSLLFFIFEPNIPIGIAAQRMISISQSYPLLAIPLFVIAGNLMNSSGITKRLVSLASALTGHLKGGLAQVSIVLSGLMGGVSGSAIADAAMQARILGIPMSEKGYSKGFSAGVIAYSALITATLPPSVGLIMYGFVSEVSIGRLFVAGIIPGVLLGVLLMIITSIISNKRNYKAERVKIATFKELLFSFKESFFALLFPILLIVGIRFGIFTPSEAGAFAVIYALVIGLFIHKELTWEGVQDVLNNSIKDIGVIMLIITTAAIFGYASSYDGLPQSLAKLISEMTTNPYMLLIIIIVFLTFVGMVLEGTVTVLLFAPIFVPIIMSAGIDPVHFGIIMMTIVTVGAMTPPVGVAMSSVVSIMDISIKEYAIESIPFLLTIFVFLLILILFPQIVLFLPNIVFGS